MPRCPERASTAICYVQRSGCRRYYQACWRPSAVIFRLPQHLWSPAPRTVASARRSGAARQRRSGGGAARAAAQKVRAMMTLSPEAPIFCDAEVDIIAEFFRFRYAFAFR